MLFKIFLYLPLVLSGSVAIYIRIVIIFIWSLFLAPPHHPFKIPFKTVCQLHAQGSAVVLTWLMSHLVAEFYPKCHPYSCSLYDTGMHFPPPSPGNPYQFNASWLCNYSNGLKQSHKECIIQTKYIFSTLSKVTDHLLRMTADAIQTIDSSLISLRTLVSVMVKASH